MSDLRMFDFYEILVGNLFTNHPSYKCSISHTSDICDTLQLQYAITKEDYNIYYIFVIWDAQDKQQNRRHYHLR